MMNKMQILKELKRGNIWNKTYKIAGINIAGVMWDNDSWKVIHENVTFDEIIKTKVIGKDDYNLDVTERTYKPIAEFYYQRELADYILKNQV